MTQTMPQSPRPLPLIDRDHEAWWAGLRRHELFGGCGLIVLTSLDEQARRDYAHALEDVAVVHKPDLVRDLPPLIERALGERLRETDPPAASAAGDAPPQRASADQSPGTSHSSPAVMTT